MLIPDTRAASTGAIIHSQCFDPVLPRLFGKSKANERAEVREVECSLPDCPLKACGTCMMLGILSSVRCPYGKWRSLEGPTKRKGGTATWIRENQTPGVPWLKPPACRIAFVGDWVYLPYAHMTMCKEVPFVSHSAFIISGTPLLKREDWTLQNVLKLVQFVPLSMMGDGIRSYQSEQVPLFMTHLYRADRAMWDAVVEQVPRLNSPPTYVGRKALLRTLKAPLSWRTKHREYFVYWTWDGEKARTSGRHAYNETWGDLKAQQLNIEVVPADDAAIVVQSAEWVTDDTEFVD